MERSRILFVENDLGGAAGSFRSLLRLVRVLDRRAYEPWVTFSRGRSHPLRSDFEGIGCRIVDVQGPCLPRDSFGRSRGRSPLHFLRGLLSRARRVASRALVEGRRAIELMWLIRAQRIELVHMNPGLIPTAVIAATICRVPVICHFRAISRLGPLGRFLSRFISAGFCISHFVREGMEPQIRCRRLHVVHNGIELPETMPPIRPRADRRSVAAVGRLVEWKGQHVLLQAAPAILRAVPDARFLIVGAPVLGAPVPGNAGGYERYLRELSRDLGLEEHVEFTGYIADVESYVRAEADVVVHTSTQGEPFGLVLIEAMAWGLPIIASRGGGGVRRSSRTRNPDCWCSPGSPRSSPPP